MGPVSAVVLSFFLVILGLTWVAAITASLHLLGVLAIIVAVVILLDTFVFYHRYYARVP